MSLTPDAIREARGLLLSGRTKDAARYLKRTLGLSSADTRSLLALLQQEIAAGDIEKQKPYVLSDMDNVLMPMVANALLGRNNPVAAIQCIRSHRNISLEECLRFMEETRRRFASQYRDTARRSSPSSSGFGRLIMIPIAIGVAFSAFALYEYISQQRLIRNSQRVEGTVVDMHRQTAKSGGYRYAPIIEYHVDGSTYRHQSGIHSGNSSYYINETIPLFVDRDLPEEVLIDTFTDRWMGITITGFLGFGFMVVPAVMMLWEYVRSKRNYIKVP